MKHYYYYAVCGETGGKSYAEVWRVHENGNLLHTMLDGEKHGTIAALPVETCKRAKEIVRCWNETYLKDGRYIFDSLSSAPVIDK